MNRYITTFDAYCNNESVWLFAIEYNALFKKELKKNDDMIYLGSFPNEKFFQWRLYSSVVEFENKLYFIPCSANNLGIYDLNKSEFRSVDIGIEKEDDLENPRYQKKFVSGVIYNDKLYMIPCCYDKLVVFDLKTEVVHSDSLMYTSLKNMYASNTESFSLCWNAKSIDDKRIVYDLHSGTNVLVEYDLEKNEWKDRRIGASEERNFCYCEYESGFVWLFDDRNKTLVKFGIDDDTLEEFAFKSESHSNDMLVFSNMFYYQNRIWLINALGGSTIWFDIDKREFETVKELTDIKASFSPMVIKTAEFLCLLDSSNHRLCIYENNTWNYFECLFSEESLSAIKHYYYQLVSGGGKLPVTETFATTLSDFLKEI